MERELLVKRINQLGFDPAHFFVTLEGAMLLHEIPRKGNAGVEKIHLVVHPDLFAKLEEKHGLLPVARKTPDIIRVMPDVEVSTRSWEKYHHVVQLKDGVPVLRLGKLLYFCENFKGNKEPSDIESIKKHVRNIMDKSKCAGMTDVDIGKQLGISAPTVSLYAERIMGIKPSDWQNVGKLDPAVIVKRLEETHFNWNRVGAELLPGIRDPKLKLQRMVKGTKPWEEAKRRL